MRTQNEGGRKYRISLVSEEVNLLESFIFDVSQAVGFIPSVREDIKGDLTADGIGQWVIRKLFFYRFDKRCS
jgi:hypothetical protein